MDIKFYGKPVMTRFVVIDGKEFKASELYLSLDQIMQTEEDDCYGDYSLRDYQIVYQEVVDQLVNMGLVKNYTGSRMANLYCMKDKEGIEDLLDTLYKLDTKEDKNEKDF